MLPYTILAGGFSTFIASYKFTPPSVGFDGGPLVNASLVLLRQTETGTNPSWLATLPGNSSVLYAVNEQGPIGKLQSFVLGGDDKEQLTLVDEVATGGDGPTFTAPLSSGEVTAMNFGSPNAAFVPTNPNDPARFDHSGENAAQGTEESDVVPFPVGSGESHPHMSLEIGNEVFVADLGADKIWRLGKGANGKFAVQGQIDVEAGSGPRHLASSNGVLFILNEKTSTLIAVTIPAAPNGTVSPVLAKASIIPPDAPQGSKFAAAEILLSTPTKKFPDSLIYVSNRNIGDVRDKRGDTIAIFEFNPSSSSTGGVSQPSADRKEVSLSQVRRDLRWSRGVNRRDREVGRSVSSTGELRMVKQVFTGLGQIRSMSLGPADDQGGDAFIVAGGNVDGGVVVFQRVELGRNLVEVARNTEIQNRTSFVFTK